jgi:hypothetical protein
MDFVPLVQAVAEIASRKGVTEAAARRVLVATFMDGGATPICDAFWRRAFVRGEVIEGPAPDENAVPADFWHLNHAEMIPRANGLIPSGRWGWWERSANFHIEECFTGFAAASRYPDLEGLGRYGSEPVTVQMSAMDVRICQADVDAIILRGGFSALLKRVERRPSITTGNVTKSDAERLWAKVCCNFLWVGGASEIAHNPDKLLKAVRSTSETVSEDQAVSDKVMRRMAELIAEEAAKLAYRQGPPA